MAKKSSKSKTNQPKPAKQSANKLEQLETQIWFLPLLGALGLLMGILLFDSNLSLSGDNAQFIDLGHSLAAGNGLSEGLNDVPKPHTKYPFGFPLLLAIVHLIVPGSIIALKSFIVLLYALSIPLIYKFTRHYAAPPLSIFVATLCLISTPLLDYSHQVMSEIPFVPFALLGLILIQRAHENESTRTLLFAILAMIAAYYIRSAGVVLVGTGILFFALHQKWKEAGIVAGVSFLLALPWQIRNRALGGTDYINQLLSVDPYRPDAGMLTFGALIERLTSNIEIYGLYIIPKVFVPSVAIEPNFILGLIFSGLVLYYIITGLRDHQLPAIFLICYIGLYLLWPRVWSDIRFLIPAIPILFYALLSSVSNLVQKINVSFAPKAVVIAFLIAIASNSAATHDLSERIGQLPPNWKNYFEAGEWIKNNTEPNTKILCRKPFLIKAIANRRTDGYVWEEPDAVIADMEQKDVDYVIIDQLFPSTPQYLVPAITAHRDRFEVIHIVRNPDTYILRFKKNNAPN